MTALPDFYSTDISTSPVVVVIMHDPPVVFGTSMSPVAVFTEKSFPDRSVLLGMIFSAASFDCGMSETQKNAPKGVFCKMRLLLREHYLCR